MYVEKFNKITFFLQDSRRFISIDERSSPGYFVIFFNNGSVTRRTDDNFFDLNRTDETNALNKLAKQVNFLLINYKNRNRKYFQHATDIVAIFKQPNSAVNAN